METRAEHLQWCKDRAIEILDKEFDAPGAYTSFVSDMNKHSETQNHSAIQLGLMMIFSGNLSTIEEMRKFINGFN
jgi:hypothetical protein